MCAQGDHPLREKYYLPCLFTFAMPLRKRVNIDYALYVYEKHKEDNMVTRRNTHGKGLAHGIFFQIHTTKNWTRQRSKKKRHAKELHAAKRRDT
jgi:hypothetical protein